MAFSISYPKRGSVKKSEDYYDPYDDYYTPTKAKKKSSWSWSKSSWSYYSFFNTEVEENNEDLFVKSPENYETPTVSQIKNKTHVYKQSSYDTIKELARVCYLKMIDDPDYISEKYKDFDSLSDLDKQDYTLKKEFYDTIYESFIPGFTPLEQAIAIYLKMKTKEHQENDDSDGEGFNSTLDFNREIYSDPTINEQLEINELSKSYKMQIMNLISLIGDFGSQFKVEKEIDEKIVSNSDEYTKKIMRDYSQFHMIDLYQKMFPNFRSKFLTKDLTVNVPVDRKEQKQKIIIILDFSGSMDDHEKQIWVNAILIDRFRYVLKGEAEVFFSYFVSDPNQMNFQHIKNREDVVKFWETFSNEPNGGMTEVGNMVQRIADEISNGRLMNLDVNLSEEKPEILVINDGNDSVGTNEFPYKVNALCLMEKNYELRDLCINSGGKKIHVNEENVITMFSSEGSKVLT
jgi:hypothetical protein